MKKSGVIGIVIAVIVVGGLSVAGTYYYKNQEMKTIKVQNAVLKSEVEKQTAEDSQKAVQINLNIKGGAFDLAKQEIAKLPNPKQIEALTDTLNQYEQNAKNFNANLKGIIQSVNQNGNINAFTNAIDGISTNNLITPDVDKLNKIKAALPSLQQLEEVQKLILNKQFTKAKDELNTINENALVNSGLLSKEKFEQIQSFVNSGLAENKNIIDSINQNVQNLKNKQLQILNQI